ncbi:squalene/phytoene synthase family protein [[Pseudomonas] carboxydohydrogena]|uniref:Squalene/phytoene synthase family protein n=1 Tax=Afipia carboxydohydrogena TaxID=290 RepID=A0ABY8BN26_AFICR|nr:phytoene/squalene synthase family protein [[Pseudomonas] carboxydohydrogena]WEF50130.1 squalene/phytoene synthase family protein [[Pseudomonas] carboxydohydrogena]
MSGADVSGADDASYCAQLVRDHDFERYAATLFMPPRARRPVLALYAFNTELRRIRDHVSQPLPGEIRLQWWRDLIDGDARGSVEANPVAAELMTAVSNHDLPRAELSRMVDARVFDLYDDPMLSLDMLERYCDDTASRLFSLSARILGGTSRMVEHVAHHAGIAQGLLRAIEGLPLHAARRQLYLPRDMLNVAGVREADIFAGRSTPQLQVVIGKLVASGRCHLDKASELLVAVPAGAKRIFLPLALVRRALDSVESNGDPFAPIPPSRLRTLWTLWRTSKSGAFRG